MQIIKYKGKKYRLNCNCGCGTDVRHLPPQGGDCNACHRHRPGHCEDCINSCRAFVTADEYNCCGWVLMKSRKKKKAKPKARDVDASTVLGKAENQMQSISAGVEEAVNAGL